MLKNIGHVKGYQNNPQTPRILSGPLVFKFLDLPLACVNLHSDSGAPKNTQKAVLVEFMNSCNNSESK